MNAVPETTPTTAPASLEELRAQRSATLARLRERLTQLRRELADAKKAGAEATQQGDAKRRAASAADISLLASAIDDSVAELGRAEVETAEEELAWCAARRDALLVEIPTLTEQVKTAVGELRKVEAQARAKVQTAANAVGEHEQALRQAERALNGVKQAAVDALEMLVNRGAMGKQGLVEKPPDPRRLEGWEAVVLVIHRQVVAGRPQELGAVCAIPACDVPNCVGSGKRLRLLGYRPCPVTKKNTVVQVELPWPVTIHRGAKPRGATVWQNPKLMW